MGFASSANASPGIPGRSITPTSTDMAKRTTDGLGKITGTSSNRSTCPDNTGTFRPKRVKPD